MTERPMTIIGAGHAAVRAALSLREAGHAGAITMIATEGADGPYERPPLSKWSPDLGVTSVPIVSDSVLADADIDLVTGTVKRIDAGDRTVTLSDERVIPYEQLLLATGARPRQLSIDGIPESRLLYLRDIADAKKIQSAANTARSAVIIGGGFIGLELAASLRGRGIDVHVLEVEQRLLSRAITADVAKIVQDLHVANGVALHFGAQIAGFTDPNTLVLKDGTEILADLIIVGVGSIPNTAIAEQAGLTVSNGIVVDAHLRTSDPHIFAAGDCCSFPLYGDPERMTRLESWKAAGDQGALVGQNMLSDTPKVFDDVPWFWSNQYDHVVQVAGLSPPDAEMVERHYGTDFHVSFSTLSDGTLASACGIGPSTKVAKDIRFSAKLIAAGTKIDTSSLADTKIGLKTLL